MSDMVMKIIATVCTLLALSLIILAESKYQTWSDLISDLTKENDLAQQYHNLSCSVSLLRILSLSFY
jgi:hypothetical protein